MRIGIVTKWLDEPYTGIGQYTYKLIKGLLQVDKENSYVFIHKKGGKSDLYEKGKELFLPKFGGGPMWLLPANFFLSIQRNQLDVVHEPYLGLLLPSDFKQVVTVHDISPYLYGMGHPTFTLYFKTFMKKAVKRADRIITVSENTKKDVIKHFNVNQEKIVRIHNGVEHVEPGEGDVKAIRKRFGLDGPYILTVGSLIPVKNLATAIDAYAMAVEKGRIEHKLVLAGKKDNDYERLQGLVDKHGIGKRVVFTDYLQWSQVIALYAGADMLLFPSIYEGFGFPPLEAMGHGVPTIVSNTSSLPEVMGDAGILLDPKDTDAWAEAILRLVNDDGSRKDLISKGKEQVKRFTWENCARETLDVYQDLARK